MSVAKPVPRGICDEQDPLITLIEPQLCAHQIFLRKNAFLS